MLARKPRSSMRARSKSRAAFPRQNRAFDEGSKNFARGLKPSLRLPEFVAQFTFRAGQVLGARSVVLALAHDRRLETVLANDVHGQKSDFDWQTLNEALTTLASSEPEPVFEGNAAALLGKRFLSWRRIWFVRLSGTDGDLLGALCLIDCAKQPTQEQRKLLETLASHASIALENSRLFSRIEHSKRQWVEDFDAINDLIIVHDPANVIIRVNRSLADALGSVPSELVGKSTRVLGAIAPDASSMACPFCQESERGEKESVLIAGARALLISTSRIAAGTEEGSRTIHVLKDITEQRRYQMQLQRERDFNTKILNSTQSMIVVLDTAGLVSYANRRCYESGYTKENLLGRRFSEFIPGNRRTLFEAAFDGAVRGVTSENLELPLRRGNRSTGQFSITFSPMRDERARVNSIIVVITDITDAAVLQAQLRHSEKMAALGQLVSGVAHEINNPLAAIVGYSDLLLEDTKVPESNKEELRIISKEAERAKDIVQNLLRFARQMPAKREALDVHAVLQQVLQLRAYGAAGDGVEVVERFDNSLPAIFGDAQQLQQLFLNILNNAYDAVRESGRDGRIEIETHQRNDSVEIALRDNGVGITDMARIFEPFYTTKEVGKGTGLGLSICYGIVREHGGDISCKNNTDGEGCTFLVRLPIAKAAGMTLSSETANSSA
jgi:two-component system NtrC family sensor kinase